MNVNTIRMRYPQLVYVANFAETSSIMDKKVSSLLDRLQNLYKFERGHDITLAVVEILLGLLAAGFAGSVISKYQGWQLLIAFICGILFLYLAYRRLSKEKNFSFSSIGELKSTILLDSKTKEVERKNIIDDYIDEAIKALNSNTCNYNNYNAGNHLCDQSIENGLKSVFHPFFNNPPNLLDTPKAKFTVGAYLDYFLLLPANFGQAIAQPTVDQNVFTSRDDFGFGQHLPKTILDNEGLIDLAFSFHTQFLDTFRHERFIKRDFPFNNSVYTLITAPIPTVCEDGSTGVFYLISEKLDQIPGDFENLCQIFGRLFSNWLTRYNECVISRCEEKNYELTNPGIQVAMPQHAATVPANNNGVTTTNESKI